MFTKDEIFTIAMRQTALDLNIDPADLLQDHNIIRTPAEGTVGARARRYYHAPVACNMVSYGHNITASCLPEYAPIVREYLDKFTWYHCFETPNLYRLNDRLRPLGQTVVFMAEYFLPEPELLRPLPCDLPLRVMTQPDFSSLYTPEWSNALCAERKELDVLGVGAFDGDRLVGLAACSADCDSMWQIGVDVLPEYRQRGLAKAMTSHLAIEILNRGKVPFYCCAWSNIRSARNAVRCGFLPAWAEMTVKPISLAEEMNR